jgi:RNA polymerase sigma-70 factor (ECF subfamily)
MNEVLALTEERSTSIVQAHAVEPFEALYVRHRTAVFRYARARSSNDDDAADLTALVFERALVAWPRYRPTGGGELAWLFRIARNAAIDDARRRRLAEEREPRAPAGLAAADPQAALDRAELADEVRRLLAVLADETRDAVVLRYGVGLTAKEIGEVIGRSEAATQKLLARALVTLKEARHD